MDLKTLTDRGGFITEPPVKVKVTWTHVDKGGQEITDEFDVWVRRLAHGDMETILRKFANDQHSLSCEMIANGIRFGENADEMMDYEQALMLDPSLAKELAQAVEKVNVRLKKPSTKSKNSGSSSLAKVSEAEPSPKQNSG